MCAGLGSNNWNPSGSMHRPFSEAGVREAKMSVSSSNWFWNLKLKGKPWLYSLSVSNGLVHA